MKDLTARQRETLWHLVLGAEVALLLAEREPGAHAAALATLRQRRAAAHHTARIFGVPGMIDHAASEAETAVRLITEGERP